MHVMSSTYLYFLNFLSKLCTFKKHCQSVEYFFTDNFVFGVKLAIKSDVLC